MTPPPAKLLSEAEFVTQFIEPTFTPPRIENPVDILCRCIGEIVMHGEGIAPFEHTNERCLGYILQHWHEHKMQVRQLDFLGLKVNIHVSACVPPDMALFQDAAGRIHTVEGFTSC